MQSLDTVQQTAKRIMLFNALAAVVAFPAALCFAWLWLIERQHRGVLGFALIWLLVAGVSLRIHAQFLRWWHQVDYAAASRKSSSSSSNKRRRLPSNVQDESLANLEERLLAVGAGSCHPSRGLLAVGSGRAVPHAGSIPARRVTAR
jgi:hypothetical protein